MSIERDLELVQAAREVEEFLDDLDLKLLLRTTPCGAITGAATRDTDQRRRRCIQTPVDHRGPHWKNTEPISCDCHTFCRGHA